jgi:hypothetical protein
MACGEAQRGVLSMIGVPVLIFAVGFVVVVALSASSHADEPRDMSVSLIQLIANPASFDGKRVLLTGYVVLESENTAVYLHESDARYGIARSGLWLAMPLGGESHRARFHQRYVLIEGTFNARRRGHLELFSGTLEDVGRFELVEPRPGPLTPAPH